MPRIMENYLPKFMEKYLPVTGIYEKLASQYYKDRNSVHLIKIWKEWESIERNSIIDMWDPLRESQINFSEYIEKHLASCDLEFIDCLSRYICYKQEMSYLLIINYVNDALRTMSDGNRRELVKSSNWDLFTKSYVEILDGIIYRINCEPYNYIEELDWGDSEPNSDLIGMLSGLVDMSCILSESEERNLIDVFLEKQINNIKKTKEYVMCGSIVLEYLVVEYLDTSNDDEKTCKLVQKIVEQLGKKQDIIKGVLETVKEMISHSDAIHYIDVHLSYDSSGNGVNMKNHEVDPIKTRNEINRILGECGKGIMVREIINHDSDMPKD